MAQERRNIQRILTTQPGQPAFWLQVGQTRLRLLDLSLAGFAVAVAEPLHLDDHFDFRILREGDGGQVAGHGHVVGVLENGQRQFGCAILALDGPGRERLHAWLVDHVMACSALPLTEQEAQSIVEGPSIV